MRKTSKGVPVSFEPVSKVLLSLQTLFLITKLSNSIILLKWNSRQKATEALFAIEYESNLRVKAYLRRKRHF